MADEAGTYEEWRVTGDPGQGYPPYDFTWSKRLNPHLGDPEHGAHRFAEMIRGTPPPWMDGPHLSRRTVVVGEWTEVDHA